MTDFSERALVNRLLRHDEEAFDQFFTDYFPRLMRFASRRLGDEDAAQDVVQATLVQAVRRLETWRGEAGLFTWLCTICRHHIGAALAGSTRATTIPLADHDPQVQAALESLGAAAEGPDATLLRDDVGRAVQLVLDYLPPRYSQVLSWRYFDDLSVRDIATRLHTSPKAAESLLARARGAFREGFSAVHTQEGLKARSV